MARVLTVNVGHAEPNPYKPVTTTGIGKRPADGPVAVHDPRGGGSGLAGDHIGDTGAHGGPDQAVYAFAREDLDRWEARLGRELPNGSFGENLTTEGLDLAGVRVGEVWRVGDTVQLQVSAPRIPCATFRGRMGEPGWLKTFTADAHPGAYLRVLVPGDVRAGDPVAVLRRPDHDVTVALVFRAEMGERDLLPRLAPGRDDLEPHLRAAVDAAG